MVQPPPPRRTRGIPGWFWGIVGCGCLFFLVNAILTAIMFPGLAQAKEKARQTACLSNLKQISEGMRMYALDHNGQLPEANKWMDAITPHVKAVKVGGVYRCPSVSTSGFGYAFDSRLSGKKAVQIANPQQTMLVYDSTNLNRNATDAGTSLTREKPRHGRIGNNILYANGSARFTRVTPSE